MPEAADALPATTAGCDSWTGLKGSQLCPAPVQSAINSLKSTSIAQREHGLVIFAYLQESVEHIRDARCDLPIRPAAVFWTLNALHGLYLDLTWRRALLALEGSF